MTRLLKAVLFVTGLVIVWLGLNVALGGMATLGWQGATAFFAITDPVTFAVQDNHIRFIAGVWTSVGLLMIAGSLALARMHDVLLALMAMVFVGGLMRVVSGDLDVVLSAEIAPSLLAELVLFPLLGAWIYAQAKSA